MEVAFAPGEFEFGDVSGDFLIWKGRGEVTVKYVREDLTEIRAIGVISSFRVINS